MSSWRPYYVANLHTHAHSMFVRWPRQMKGVRCYVTHMYRRKDREARKMWRARVNRFVVGEWPTVNEGMEHVDLFLVLATGLIGGRNG